MQNEWYYQRAGLQYGPISRERLIKLFLQELLPAETPVYCEGMPDWMPAQEAGEYLVPPQEPAPLAPESEQMVHAAVEAPVFVEQQPVAESPDEPTHDEDPRPARRWHEDHAVRRFMARMADYAVLLVVGGIVMGILGYARLMTPYEMRILLFTITLAWIPIEAVLLSLVGTTPGRLLAATCVRDPKGRRLGFSDALRRSFTVWWMGMGAGLPFFAPLATVLAWLRLRRHGVTVWDERCECRTVANAFHPFQIAALIVLALAAGALVVAGIASLWAAPGA